MSKYPFEENTRVSLLSSVGDVSAPTVAELNGGTDVTCDLTRDGLSITRPSSDLTRELWAAARTRQDPDRYSVQVGLTGWRFEQPDAEPLYDACGTFRAKVVLVARFGVPFDSAWSAGQVVDVVVGRWGKRATVAAASNRAVTFTVPILVSDDDDAAVVAA